MHSGASNRSEPTLIVRPSGNCKVTDQSYRRVQINEVYCVILYEGSCLFGELGILIKIIAGIHNSSVSSRRSRSVSEPDIAEFLFDLAHSLEIRSTVKRVSPHE